MGPGGAGEGGDRLCRDMDSLMVPDRQAPWTEGQIGLGEDFSCPAPGGGRTGGRASCQAAPGGSTQGRWLSLSSGSQKGRGGKGRGHCFIEAWWLRHLPRQN